VKAAPTLDGGLKIEAEVPRDWQILRWIVVDAAAGGGDLADRLGSQVVAREVVDDWKELVVPELREEFGEQLGVVTGAVEKAVAENGRGAGAIYVPAGEVMSWYGALNQARLGLEEAYKFDSEEVDDLVGMSAEARSGYFRGMFYRRVQMIILDHLM